MRLREYDIRYTVRRHGNEYVEEEEPSIVYVCPECFSTDVRDVDVGDDSSADYICNACGCCYDAYMSSKRTKAGNIRCDDYEY